MNVLGSDMFSELDDLIVHPMLSLWTNFFQRLLRLERRFLVIIHDPAEGLEPRAFGFMCEH